MTKQNLRFLGAAFSLLLVITSRVNGGVPAIQVTVSDGSGKVAYRGATGQNATFSTATLMPGHYIVQFTTANAAAKGRHYLVVVSAGAKKVIATGVKGETLLGGGAAMKVNVDRGLKITGQLADEQSMARESGSNVRVVGNQRFVWVKVGLGTNLGGHWVEEGLAPTLNVTRMSQDSTRKLQDRGGEGSMVASRAETLGW